MFNPLAQTLIPSAEQIEAFQNLGLPIITLIVTAFIAWLAWRMISKSLDALNRNTDVLKGITDSNSSYQSRSLEEKAETRKVIATTNNVIADMTKSLAEAQQKLAKDVEGATDALRGRDGVIEQLRTSITRITELGEKTRMVADETKSIISTLDDIKKTVVSADTSNLIDQMKQQLVFLTNAVELIPKAVSSAEQNIITAINKQPSVPSPPVVDDATIASKPLVNGSGKEPEDVSPPQT